MIRHSENALYFDGVASRVVFGDNLDKDGSAAFSISCWVKTTISQTSDIVAKTGLVSTLVAGYSLSLTSGGLLSFSVFSDRVSNFAATRRTTSTRPLLSDHWHHVVATYDGSKSAAGIKIYIDGTLAAVTTVSDTLGAGSSANSGAFSMGSSDTSSGFFDGRLDEVSLYSKVLSAPEVTDVFGSGTPPNLAITGPFSSLEGYWYCGDYDTYPTVLDHVGSLDGTMIGMSASSIVFDAPRPIIPSYCVYTDGVDDRLALSGAGPLGTLTHLTPFTVSLWVWGSGYDTFILGTATYPNVGWSIMRAGGILYFRMTDGTSNPVGGTSSAWKDYGWNHIVITNSGANDLGCSLIYINGVYALDAGYLGGLTLTSPGAPVYLGSNPELDQLYLGGISSLAAWSRVLSSSEVTTLYNGGSPGDLYYSGLGSSLIGWWPIGEDFTGTTFVDLGPSASSGTATGMSLASRLQTSPKFSLATTSDSTYSLTFGSTKYVTMGDQASLSFDGTTPFSLGVWFKTTTTTASTLIGKAQATTPFTGYALSISASGQIVASLVGSLGESVTLTTNTTSFNDGLWHLAVWVNSGSGTASGQVIYVDGTAVTATVNSDNLASAVTNTAPFTLGSKGASAYFTGSLDSATVWSRPLSALDVRTLFSTRSPAHPHHVDRTSLLGYWRLGDGDTYPTVTDSGPLGLNGTMTNMSSGDIVLGAPSEVLTPNSLQFDGINDYLSLGNLPIFDFTGPFTLSMWVRAKDHWGYTTVRTLADKRTSSGLYPGWQLYVNQGNLYFSIGQTGNLLSVSTSLKLQTSSSEGSRWYHIAVTYDGSKKAKGLNITVDGNHGPVTVLYDTLTSYPTTSAVARVAVLGTLASHGGYMQNFTVYNRALSEWEIQLIAYGLYARDPGAVGPIQNLVGWWRMGNLPDVYPTIRDLAPVNNNNGTMTNMVAGNFVTEAKATPILNPVTDPLIIPTGMLQDLGAFYNIGTSSTPIPTGSVQPVGDMVNLTFNEVISSGETVEVLTYKMRARTLVGSGYVTWVVITLPDYSGGQAPVPILPGSAVIATSWGSDVVQQVPVSTVESVVTLESPGSIADPQGGTVVVLVDTASATWDPGDTVTLPSSPRLGSEIVVKDSTGLAGTKSISVVGNGKLIDGQATQTISTARGSLTLIYTGSAWSLY